MTDRRLMPRFALGLTCTIRRRGDAIRVVQLIDVSQSGCRLEALCRLHAGETVWMAIGTMRGIVGTVMWASGDFAGIAFADPLHLGVVDDLVIRAGIATGETERLRDIAQRSELQAARIGSAAADQLLELARGCRVDQGPPAPPRLSMEP